MFFMHAKFVIHGVSKKIKKKKLGLKGVMEKCVGCFIVYPF